jgi:hypothetical protein
VKKCDIETPSSADGRSEEQVLRILQFGLRADWNWIWDSLDDAPHSHVIGDLVFKQGTAV